MKVRDMKLQIFTLFVLMALVSGCGKRDGIYKLDIYATNDVHGKYFDSLYSDNKANPASLANVSAYMKRVRAEKGRDNLLFGDIGDLLQGDNAAYYANFVDTTASAGKHLAVRVAESIGYDFMVVGNHDIETGHPVYDRVKRELSIPYLAANAIDKKSGKAYFQEYAIFRRGGLKVAVIGLTNANIKSWLDERLWSGLEFAELSDLSATLVKRVKERENPDITILAVHAGVGNENADVYEIENPAKYLASHTEGVDLVLASHDHQVYIGKVYNGADSVLLVDGGSRAGYLSHINVSVEYRDGKIVSKNLTGESIPMAQVEKDEAYIARFKEDFNNVKAFSNRTVGVLPKEIYTRDAYFGPSDYMSLIHSIQLLASGAELSFAAPLTQNGYIKAGEFDYQDLFTIYPFENQLFVVKLTGEQIKNYLEKSYDNWIGTMKSRGDHIMKIRYNDSYGRYSFANFPFNFDSAGNLDYEVDVTEPFGSRIRIKGLSSGEEFSSAKSYTVALSSYRASGGGDLLVSGAGIPAEELSSIVVEKMDDIRSLIYTLYKNGKGDEIKELENWKFVPESLAADALKRDKALLFGADR